MDYRQKIEAKLKTLPHKYQVRYALDCALEVKHLMQDPRALKALEIIELWLQGKATKDEVRNIEASILPNIYKINFSNHEACVFHTITTINSSTYPIAAVLNAAYAAYYASKTLNLPIEYYYTKLLKFIDNISKLERIIYDFTR